MLIAAAIVVIALVLAAVNVMKKSLRELSQEEKVRLVDAAARAPIYGFLAAVAIFGAWGAIVWKRPDLTTPASLAVFAAVLALSAASGFVAYRGYARIGMPPRFLRSFLIARGLRLTGAAVLFAAVAEWLLRSHA